MGGNGRLARFIFNAMLVTGGRVWTIVPLEQRCAYMAAIEQASSCSGIQPRARFFADLLREQNAAATAETQGNARRLTSEHGAKKGPPQNGEAQ